MTRNLAVIRLRTEGWSITSIADYLQTICPTIARIWPETLSEHQKWWDHYNHEHHFAHRTRQDDRHSPYDALRGVLSAPIRKRFSRGCCMPRS